MEESAEGCRWLLEQWAQLLNVVDAKVPWGDPEVIRFCGLLGKRGIEAHFDPELNALFHAFDAIAKGLGQKFWTERRDHIPLGYYGGFQYVNYRIITAPPRDKNEAMVLICTVIAKNVGRLEKLLKEYEAIEAEEADERYDRAALDCSRPFERHRRYQSARTRELLRVLEEFRRMKAVASDQWQVASDGECQMTDGKCQMTDGEVQGTDVGEDPVVGQDSNLVTENSTNDKIGILSHENRDATDGTSDGQEPKKAQNEANSKMTQTHYSQKVESRTLELVGCERSQSPGGGHGVAGADGDRVETIMPTVQSSGEAGRPTSSPAQDVAATSPGSIVDKTLASAATSRVAVAGDSPPGFDGVPRAVSRELEPGQRRRQSAGSGSLTRDQRTTHAD